MHALAARAGATARRAAALAPSPHRATPYAHRPRRRAACAVAMPSMHATTSGGGGGDSGGGQPPPPPSKPPKPPPAPPALTPRGSPPPGGWASIGTSPTGAAFVVDKPPGWTSFDVCGAVRGALRVKRVGHAGTLDPCATGVLVVCAGKATKAVPAFTEADKEYTGVLRLGEATPTLDAGSLVSETAPWHHVTDADLAAAAAALTGPAVTQVVPMFSAVRIGGQRLYTAAREGVEVARPPRAVRVDAFEVTRLGEGGYTPTPVEAAAAAKEVDRMLARAGRAAAEEAGVPVPAARDGKRVRRRRRKAGAAAERPPPPPPLPAPPPPPPIDPPTPGPHGGRDVAFRVACAKGTYIRTLASDLGAAVGSAAHVVSLRRTRVGVCGVGEAWPVEELVAAARAGVGPRVPKVVEEEEDGEEEEEDE